MKKVLFFLLATLMFTSCELQKRRYNQGFHVQWHVFNNGADSPANSPDDHVKRSDLNRTENLAWDISSLPPDITLPDGSKVPSELAITPYKLKSNASIRVMRESDKPVPRDVTFRDQIAGEIYSQAEGTSPKANRKKERSATHWALAALVLGTLGFAGISRLGKRTVHKLTKWAKYNQNKTIATIAALQTGVMALGIQSGYSLRQMGLELGDEVGAISMGTFLLGFSLVPLFPKAFSILNPKNLFKQRMTFVVASIAGLVMSLHFGNNVSQKHANTYGEAAIEYVDNFVFGDSPAENPGDEVEEQKLRSLLSGGSIGLAVFLIIISAILLCAGLCGIGFGIAFLMEAAAMDGILMLLGSAIVLFLAYLGFNKAIEIFQSES